MTIAAVSVLSACTRTGTEDPESLADARHVTVPPLMLPYGAGWSGGMGRANGTRVPAEDYLPDDYLNGAGHNQAAIIRGVPADKVRLYLQARISGHYIPPADGIGPMWDDPDRPFFNNSTERATGIHNTLRVADLNNDAARNLKPWALEAVRKQNELVIGGQYVQTRQARCWELGVPNFNEVPQPLYFIQTPDEIVMYMGHRVRHVYMNVPHSAGLEPSWYGESVGHYEGDTLVVETIGLNDKTFVDGYRTPHTDKMRVVERFRVINGGKGLDTSITVDDPDTFYEPWQARRPRYIITNRPLNDQDRICAAGNEDVFNVGLEPLQKAGVPDF